MNFEFATAQKIFFGPGVINHAPDLIRGYGSRAVLITGQHNCEDNPIIRLMATDHEMKMIQIVCVNEPDIEFIQKSVEEVRRFHPDVVVGIGGGSVIDTGKALAILAANEGNVSDYLEVVGKGRQFVNHSLPFIAIPTTSGTGSEVTRNAVINDRNSSVKASLRSPFMLPSVALIDPELTLHLPPEITAATGMDALTQVIEPYLTRKANLLTDAICLQAISMANETLVTSYLEPENINARERMSLISLFGGLALANSGLGVVHGFAAAIGGMYPKVKHGQICAAILPSAFLVNRLATKGGPGFEVTFHRMEKISQLLSGDCQQPGEEILAEMARIMKIPSLSKLGIMKTEFNMIIEKATQSSSMKGNPISLSSEDLMKILDLSY